LKHTCGQIPREPVLNSEVHRLARRTEKQISAGITKRRSVIRQSFVDNTILSLIL
jgi:hypothetical protein